MMDERTTSHHAPARDADHESAAASDHKKSSRPWVRPVLLLSVVAGALVLAYVFDMQRWLGGLQGWIDSLGPWAPIAFVLIYIAATVLAVPGTALTLLAGAVFGAVLGVVYASLGATLGATAAFLVARYFARDSVKRWIGDNERFAKLDRLSDRYGGWVVAITRLVPLFPFNLLNYALGLTRVSLWTYVILTWLCMLPATVLYVVGGDAIMTAFREGEIPWLLVVGVAAGIGVLTLVGFLLRRRIVSHETEE